MSFTRIHVIANPVSGQDGAPFAALESARTASDATWTVTRTEPGQDPADLARTAVDDGADLVIASGGDGTVSGVAEGLQGTDAALGIVPSGTANVIAAELGIPEDPDAALDIALGSSERRVLDLGRMSGPDGHAQYFLLRMGLGLKAAMITQVGDDAKSSLGRWAYLWTLLKRWFNASPVTYRLTLDGEERTERGVTCIVNNAGVLGLAPFRLDRVHPDDGVLDVVVVRRTTLGTLLRIFWGVLVSALPGRDFDPRPLDYMGMWSARRVGIDCDEPQPVDCDGEACEVATPIQVEILPGAVQVVVPAPVSRDQQLIPSVGNYRSG